MTATAQLTDRRRVRCCCATGRRDTSPHRSLVPPHCSHPPAAHVNTDYTSLYRLLHTHALNGRLSGTIRVSRYQKGKTNLDFTEARDSEWQWHQLGRMQVCTSLQTNNHASTPPLSFYRPDALPAAQPTESKHYQIQKAQLAQRDRATRCVSQNLVNCCTAV